MPRCYGATGPLPRLSSGPVPRTPGARGQASLPRLPSPQPPSGAAPRPWPLAHPQAGGGARAGYVCSTLSHARHAHAGTRHTCEATRGSQWGCRSRRVASSRGPTSPRAGRRRGEADLSSKTRLGSRRPRSPEPGLRGPGEGPTLPVCLLAGGREEGQGSVGLGFRGHAGLRGRPEQL